MSRPEGGRQTPRNDNPEGVHEDEIEPEIIWFWTIIYLPCMEFIKQTRSVVQQTTIELTR
jgi:hypothetical protein